jgi:hypothetical protein
MTRTFTSAEMLEILWESNDVVEDRVIGNGRWSIEHEIVFKHEDKFYRTTYSVGATESQDERPWEYQPIVTVTQVHQVERTVLKWEAV